jgi:hypothetical protein
MSPDLDELEEPLAIEILPLPTPLPVDKLRLPLDSTAD